MKVDNGTCKIHHDDFCPICGEELMDGDRLLVMVESGQMDTMKRDPNFLKFIPDHSNEEDLMAMEEATVSLLHADCLVSQARQEGWGRFSPTRCDVCEAQFLEDIPRWAFRLRIGGFDFDSGAFIPEDAAENVAILCPPCFEFQLGEGRLEESMLQTG
jgi:hypothetical protein